MFTAAYVCRISGIWSHESMTSRPRRAPASWPLHNSYPKKTSWMRTQRNVLRREEQWTKIDKHILRKWRAKHTWLGVGLGEYSTWTPDLWGETFHQAIHCTEGGLTLYLYWSGLFQTYHQTLIWGGFPIGTIIFDELRWGRSNLPWWMHWRKPTQHESVHMFIMNLGN